MKRRGRIVLFIVMLGCGVSIGAAAPPPSPVDAAPPSPALEAAIKKLNLPGVVVNVRERCVDVEASVCLRRGMLELVACTKGTKEHESIIVIEAKALHVHTALLLLGAKSGSPASRKLVDEPSGRWIDLPPSGGAVDVFLAFQDKEGKMTEHPISEFITRSKEGPSDKPEAGAGPEVKLPTHTFLFAGSRLVGEGPGPRQYLSDESGSVISLSTFGDELLCLPEVHGQDNESLMWEINSSALPAIGTKVTLRLRPQFQPAAKPGRNDTPETK